MIGARSTNHSTPSLHGGVVNDPEVYQGLKDVVGGIRKSRVGKGVIHHYQKKGSKSQTQPREAPPEDNP